MTDTDDIDRARSRFSARTIAVWVLAVGALGLAGCSSTGTTTTASNTSSTIASTSTSYPAGKEQVCAARDQLKESVAALAKPSLLIGGQDAIGAALDKVQTDVDALEAAAKQDYKEQVDAVDTSLKNLRTAVDNLGNGKLSDNLQAVGTAITDAGTATEDLFNKLKTACGS